MKATIQALQNLAGLSDSEMARRTGIPRTTYQGRIDLTKPKSEVTLFEAERIAEALRVTVELLETQREEAIRTALADGFLEKHRPKRRGLAATGESEFACTRAA